MAFGFKGIFNGLRLWPQNTTPPSTKGDMRYNSSTDKLELYNGTVDPLVSEADTATLTNKTISGASNAISNVPAGSLTGTTLASNVVTSSLTSVGTIASGTWQGNGIDVAHGGTGDVSTTAYGILTGGTTSTGAFQNIGTGTLGQIVTSAGPGTLPVWGASALTNPMTTTGDIIYSSNNSGTPARLPVGTTNEILTVASGLPAYSTQKLPSNPVTNPAFMTMATNGQMATSVSTVGGIVGSNIAASTIGTGNLNFTPVINSSASIAGNNGVSGGGSIANGVGLTISLDFTIGAIGTRTMGFRSGGIVAADGPGTTLASNLLVVTDAKGGIGTQTADVIFPGSMSYRSESWSQAAGAPGLWIRTS